MRWSGLAAWLSFPIGRTTVAGQRRNLTGFAFTLPPTAASTRDLYSVFLSVQSDAASIGALGIIVNRINPLEVGSDTERGGSNVSVNPKAIVVIAKAGIETRASANPVEFDLMTPTATSARPPSAHSGPAWRLA